jgi:tRNA A-37 threonylcarbamoyl transferase component Bud32
MIELKAGDLLDDRYEVVCLLAEGGMSRVYEVRDKRLPGRLVAKEMREITDDPELLKLVTQQFEREAEILSELSHPNLPRVTDTFHHRGRRFLVEELVEGRTLEDLEPLELTENKILRYAEQILDCLSFLHQNGLIYRDLKPSNVMLEDNGTIKLIDFGIVRRLTIDKTRDTLVMGTPGFAAPEQYGWEQTDQHSDIFSLGALMHHLLTGRDPSRTPFVFPSVRSLAPQVSETTARVIHRAVQMEPENRFSSAQEMKRALRGEAPLSAEGESFACEVGSDPTARRLKRGVLTLGLGAASVLLFPLAPVSSVLGGALCPFFLGVQWLAEKRAQSEQEIQFGVSADGLAVGLNGSRSTIRWEQITSLSYEYLGLENQPVARVRARDHEEILIPLGPPRAMPGLFRHQGVIDSDKLVRTIVMKSDLMVDPANGNIFRSRNGA